MIDLNDLQKPATAVLAIGAAATVGFVAGYIVGRDPETARRLVRSVAGGLTRLQVAAADAWESLGDLWADARAEAQQEVEAERFAAEASAAVPTETATAAAKAAVAVAATGSTAAASPRRRGTRGTRKKARKTAKTARGAAAARSARRKKPAAVAT